MPLKITDSIYNVGVLNPNMRVFDIILRTEYGTSYNSYIVQGENKTALIDTSHLTFQDQYIEKVKSATDLDKIDYVIINHFEPDHSGALRKLLTLSPNVQIICSQAGSIYIKSMITDLELNIRTVKNGDFIDLGGKILEFIISPFLHWPDTMFTYCPEDKAIFTCDFLGAHYCEPTFIDTEVIYKDKYKKAFHEYFEAIMGPFKKHVLSALDKIKDLNLDYICVSHGPVLTKAGFLKENLEKYLQWSQPKSKEKFLLPVFYASAYGNTQGAAKVIAKAIEDTLKKANILADVPVYSLVWGEMDEQKVYAAIQNSDAFCIGSPTINKAPGPIIWEVLSEIDAINSRNKIAGVFGSYGWSGEAIPQMISFLQNYQMDVVGEGFKFKFIPTKEDLKAAYEYGVLFATKFVQGIPK